MPRKSALSLRTSDSDVVEFLSEFANFLIAAGTSHSKFESLARIAFFRAASKSAVLGNKRLNQSAVAAMTGLTRVQVRAISKMKGEIGRVKPDRTENVIAGWMTDARFLKADLSPRRLSVGRSTLGFSDLVRAYGGDVTPRAMLLELVRKKHASIQKGYAQLDLHISRSRAQTRLKEMSQSMAALLRQSDPLAESQTPIQALNFEVNYPTMSAKGRILMQKRLSERLRGLLTELRIAGEAISSESPPTHSQKRRITRTRVVLISEEIPIEAMTLEKKSRAKKSL